MSIVRELDEAYERLMELPTTKPSIIDTSNMLGFLVRTPTSKFYRPPPRGAAPDPGPTTRELENGLIAARMEIRRRSGS